jgi:hypothetical protein
LGELADGLRAGGKTLEDRPPGRVPKRRPLVDLVS